MTLKKVVLFPIFQIRDMQSIFLMTENTYRIYSRISRDFAQNFDKILLIRPIRGQLCGPSKHVKNHYLDVLWHKICLYTVFKNFNFGQFLDLFFQFDLYAGRLIREYIR